MIPTELNPWITLGLSFLAAGASFGAAMTKIGQVQAENADLRKRFETLETLHTIQHNGLVDSINRLSGELGNRLTRIETILIERKEK